MARFGRIDAREVAIEMAVIPWCGRRPARTIHFGDPMSTNISPLAGQPAQATQLVDVTKLVAAYYSLRPDPAVPSQRVSFGTSGHRGTSFHKSFNEAHVLAITQAICLYRQTQGIDGPLFIGIDTHALSVPAFESSLEVLAANGVETLIAKDGEYTPTPAVSHAILVHNRERKMRFGDGIVVTPSHNPPDGSKPRRTNCSQAA
jgi:phosphoglucomutase